MARSQLVLGFVLTAVFATLFACKQKASPVAQPAAIPPPIGAQPAPSVQPAPMAPPNVAVPPGVPSEGFAPMLAKVGPAVVNIQATKTPPRRETSPYYNDPIFRHLFGGRPPEAQGRHERSLGSGVIVRADGLILTNHHVIKEASQITISLADRREFSARIVGSDPKTDIAVLRVDARDLPFLTFGDSKGVRVGDLAFAVGSPFGLAQTATFGIVSAVGRGDIGIVDYEDFIQTDAAINPGNSGGALVNSRGELVGINTAILSRGAQGNQGVGFAVPAHMARAVMDAIVQRGRVVRGYLGVHVQDVTPALAKAFKLEGNSGVLVVSVQEGSPAAKAGIQRGDLITSLDGNATATARRLRLLTSAKLPGTSVTLQLVRVSVKQEVTLSLADLPGEGAPEAGGASGAPARGALPGATLQTLSPQLAARLNLSPNARGVVVVGVDPRSPVGQSGLRRGDVIFEANQRRVRSVEELEALARMSNGALLLLVARGERNLYIPIEP